MNILVSVILPAYNAGLYIAEAIGSILSQTYTQFELIIINDYSTDNTEAVIQSFTDHRIVYHKNPTNRGLIYNLNIGLSLAKGKYIIRMDADDISLPTRIEEQVSFMETNPTVGISGAWFQSFGSYNGVGHYEKSDNEIKLQTLFHCRFCHPTVIIRKQVIDSNNLQYSTQFPHAEDYELWARMAFITQFANLQKVLLKYRVHNNNITIKHAGTQRINSDKVIQYIFNKIGVDIEPALVPIWVKFCYANFNFTTNQINQIEVLIVNLLKANQTAAYVTQSSMEIFLAEKWFNLCYNNVKNKDVQKLFNQSKISDLVPLSNKMKFWFKGLI